MKKNKTNNDDESKYDQLKTKYNELKAKYNILKHKLQQYEGKKEEIHNQGGRYDIVVNIDSLLNCNDEGWAIDYQDQERIKSYSQLNQVAIGVIGRENTGKTFIINKIAQENFPSSYYVNTKGLSLKYFTQPQKQLKVFLDSAGMNPAVLFMSEENRLKYSKFVEFEENPKNIPKNQISKKVYEKMKEFMINDKCMTEDFIQSFILYSCNIILIVVDMLTQQDQKIIERIKTMYSGLKNIIIVHNFSKLESKEKVLEKAYSDIKGAFYAMDSIIDNTEIPIFIEKTSKNNINILHLILGREGCQSGDFFNEKTIGHIIKTIETSLSMEKFDILNKINDFWKQRNGIYFNCFREEPELPLFKIENIKNKAFIKLNFHKKLELKTPEFNVLGGLKNMELVYHLYVKTHPNNEKIYFFELPGLIKIPEIGLQLDKSENEQFLILNIENMADFPETYKCQEGGLPSGKYQKKIKINDQFGYYDVENTFTNLKNGILQMKFVLKPAYEKI